MRFSCEVRERAWARGTWAWIPYYLHGGFIEHDRPVDLTSLCLCGDDVRRVCVEFM